MKVYDILDSEGRIFALEVNNTFLSRRRVVRIIDKIPNAQVVRTEKRCDEFCEFRVDGENFVVWEPWNDSSRFWIGPKSKRYARQFEIIRRVFRDEKLFPWPWRASP